ncbi:MAG TPA: hypothetical protein VN673_19105 [Clostridia bacterium]|nr:hypothetical protein [Clostridia bacterium]
MLTQLATIKARLGLTELDVVHDEMLTRVIRALSAWFDSECNRAFARTVDAAYEFAADETRLAVPCYPIESVTRFELKRDEAEGWVTLSGVSFVLRRNCVVALPAPLGSWCERGRIVYTGGFVLPGTTPLPGQTPLPAELEHALVEQVAFWFQNRERLGLQRIWEYHGTYRQYIDFDLLTSVKAILKKYERWSV